MSVRTAGAFPDFLGHNESRAPAPAGFELRLKFRYAVGAGIFEFLVRPEVGGVGGCVECVRAVDERCAEGDGGCVFDLEEEVGGGRGGFGRRLVCR